MAEPMQCSVGECQQPARLYQHDGGVFAYCPVHAVGEPIGRDDEQPLWTAPRQSQTDKGTTDEK